MLNESHRLAGAVAGAVTAAALRARPAEALLIVVTATLSSLLPDLDCPSSKAARACLQLAPVAGVAAYAAADGCCTTAGERLVVAALGAVALAALPTALKICFGHRGALHSLILFGGALACAFHFTLPGTVWRGLAVGAAVGALVGGILPDMLTPAGVSALWPLSRRKWQLLPAALAFRTGGWGERFVFRPALALILAGLILGYTLGLLSRA